MHPRIRILALIIAGQAVCLACGLWMQRQFVIASAQWDGPSRAGSAPPADAPRPAAPDAPAARELRAREAPTGQAVLESLTGANFLAFFWICGLQSTVAYLLLTRMYTEQSQRESEVTERTMLQTKELVRTRDAVIFGLAKLAESRDPETGHHLERIALYSTRLASVLRRHPRYRHRVSPTFVRTIGISSALHDIGKVGVEDSILLKPGRLDDSERFRMQMHTTLGGECIRQIEQRLGNSNFLNMAREIAFCHHERWDGEGYPNALRGEEIPLAARIVAIADVYDALRSRRVYKEPYSHEKCVRIIREQSGRQFDPQLVEVFLSMEDQFREIADQFAEADENFIAFPRRFHLDEHSSLEGTRMSPGDEELLLQTLEKETFAAS